MSPGDMLSMVNEDIKTWKNLKYWINTQAKWNIETESSKDMQWSAAKNLP